MNQETFKFEKMTKNLGNLLDVLMKEINLNRKELKWKMKWTVELQIQQVEEIKENQIVRRLQIYKIIILKKHRQGDKERNTTKK